MVTNNNFDIQLYQRHEICFIGHLFLTLWFGKVKDNVECLGNYRDISKI